jgi:regulation of enolase protein 1 (concanavalin A-like superfamily)
MGVEATTQLWVGALDDATSSTTDRSHPPFWLPNQVLGGSGGRTRNERAYWVLDACKPSLANLNPPSGPAPQMFTYTDIDIKSNAIPNDPAFAGGATSSGGVITQKGGGDDIWDDTDAFNYAYVQVTGDFQFVTRVTSLQFTNFWAKAGIMLRDNLATDSAFAHMLISAGYEAALQWRYGDDWNAAWSGSGPTASGFPVWLRLTRTGAVVSGDWSTDGVSWSNVGTISPQIGNTAYVGLAVTSHDNSQITTATFDNTGFVSQVGPDPRPGAVCLDDQDCCGAQTSPPTAACQVDVPVPSPVTKHCILLSCNSCVALGSTCVSDADCCGFPTNHCSTKGVCAVPPPQFPYSDTVFTVDYVANCPSGELPAWRYFYWQSSTPSDSDIQFSVATAASQSLLPATIGGMSVIPLAKASGGDVTSFGSSADAYVTAALQSAMQPTTQNYVRVFADFQPSSDGYSAPTLNAWQLQYDCVAAE